MHHFGYETVLFLCFCFPPHVEAKHCGCRTNSAGISVVINIKYFALAVQWEC